MQYWLTNADSDCCKGDDISASVPSRNQDQFFHIEIFSVEMQACWVRAKTQGETDIPNGVYD